MVTGRLGVAAVAILFALAFMGMGSQQSSAEQKEASGYLVDALLGAGEGAIISEASGGKAGKGALIGAGTALGREVIVKPLLTGQGTAGAPAQVRTTVPPPPTDYPRGVDPYQMGFEEGFKRGYEQGFKAGLEAARGPGC